MRLVIVGAGVIGCSLAYRAALAGPETIVLEAVRAGLDLSPAAWLNAHNKRPRAYHDLTLRGALALIDISARSSGAADCVLPRAGRSSGCRRRRRVQGQRERRLRLQGWGALRRLDRSGRAAAPRAGQLDPRAVGDAPVASIRTTAGSIPSSMPMPTCGRRSVTAPTCQAQCRGHRAPRRRSRVRGVVLADGEAIEVDLVVNCTGAAANTWVPGHLHLPLTPKRGLTATTADRARDLRHVVNAAQC